MPVNAPGLSLIHQIANMDMEPLKQWLTQPFSMEQFGRMAGGQLIGPAGERAAGLETTPEEEQAYSDKPYLAKLGQVAGAGMVMRGGIGGGPKWMRSPGAKPQGTPEMFAAAKAGDEVAIQQLTDAMQDTIAKTAQKYVGSGRSTVAFEDLMAEGNTKMLELMKRPDAPADPAYYRAAIDNHMADFVRTEARAGARGVPLEGIESVEDVRARVRPTSAEPELGPGTKYEQTLRGTLDKMSPKQRDAVEMRLGVGSQAGKEAMEFQDIANLAPGEAGSRSYQSVQNAYTRGLAKLKQAMKEAGIEPSEAGAETEIAPPTRYSKPSEGAMPEGKPSYVRPEAEPDPAYFSRRFTTNQPREIAGGSDAPELGTLGAGELQSRYDTARQNFRLGAGRAEEGLRKIEGLANPVDNEEGIRTVVHEAGGVYRGMTPASEGMEPMVWFDMPHTADPKTGAMSTSVIPLSQLSKNNIMKQIGESMSSYDWGQSSAQ